jgi:hypothetical protein
MTKKAESAYPSKQAFNALVASLSSKLRFIKLDPSF